MFNYPKYSHIDQLSDQLSMLEYENVTLPICKLTLQANIKVNRFCEWKSVTPRETYFTAN